MNESLNKTEAEAIAELARKPFIHTINQTPHLMTPQGNGDWITKELSLPVRKFGTVELHDVDSFIDFSKKQGSLANSNIYIDVDYVRQKVVATAVFNDDSDDVNAGWKDHKAVYAPRMGEEWRRWNEANKTQMTQEVFANFLQDNIGDINAGNEKNAPNGSDILTFVSKLEETRTVKYGSAINLQNGMVQLEYVEDGDDHTKGKLEIYKEFRLGLRPFFGGEPYAIKAFLRYRIDRNTAAIKFWFELQRPDKVLEDATAQLIEKIKAEIGFPVFFGKAP